MFLTDNLEEGYFELSIVSMKTRDGSVIFSTLLTWQPPPFPDWQGYAQLDSITRVASADSIRAIHPIIESYHDASYALRRDLVDHLTKDVTRVIGSKAKGGVRVKEYKHVLEHRLDFIPSGEEQLTAVREIVAEIDSLHFEPRRTER